MGAEVKHQTVTEIPEGAVLRSEEDLARLVAFRKKLGLGRTPIVLGNGAKDPRTGEQAFKVVESEAAQSAPETDDVGAK